MSESNAAGLREEQTIEVALEKAAILDWLCSRMRGSCTVRMDGSGGYEPEDVLWGFPTETLAGYAGKCPYEALRGAYLEDKGLQSNGK